MENTTFKALAELLSERGYLASATTPLPELAISGAAHDSRDVEPGDVFVCKGAAFEPRFLAAAIASGAVAYLCDEGHAAALAAEAPGTPALVCTDLRHAMSVVSAEAWGHPDRDMEVVGITGTKGKSTVAYMVRTILDGGEPYSRAAVMGSIETYDGEERFESHNTTPEAPELWRHLAHARDHGLSMVMEVSSHALKHERADGLTYDIACFLNIGRDHISPVEHPTFEDYLSSKLLIFDRCRRGVVNLDTDCASTVLAAARKAPHLTTFSARSDAADVWAENVTPGHGFVSFDCHTPEWSDHVMVGMPGLFNVDNALAAIAICQLLGIGRQQILDGLLEARVPGRMELIESETGDIVALVDYAHNKLSFEKLFESVEAEYPGRMVVAVFGAPGNKAQERRKHLPEASAGHCDLVIYTEEDPAHEPVSEICADLAANTPPNLPYEIVEDRERAICRAVEVADADAAHREAVLCLLAKGDETRQHRGDAFEPVRTDGDIVTKALRERDERRRRMREEPHEQG
jgi:UDP-N-acetylmuramoyl-L-alanyl-D-glutamate--2,6-diaminopimelate ligase